VARVRVSTTIDAPPAEVWADVRHIDRHVDWMRDAVSIAFTGEQREGVGCAFACATRIGPFRTTDHMVVTEWADGERIGIRHVGVVTGQGVFVLAPDGAGTRFTWDEDLRFPWWLGGPVGAALAAPVLARVWRGNLRALRRRF
jgi:Polyketide cyclase / dehydrase and lipid transport